MKNEVLKDALFGAIGGIAGTLALGIVDGLISRMQSSRDKWIERELITEEPTQKLAAKAAKGLGIQLEKHTKQKLGTAIQWGYGATWGAIYGLMRKRIPAASAAVGLPFGAAFGMFGSGLLLPMFDLTPPATEFPVSSHVRGVAGHCAYAATVEGVCAGLEAIENAVSENSQKRTKSELREVA